MYFNNHINYIQQPIIIFGPELSEQPLQGIPLKYPLKINSNLAGLRHLFVDLFTIFIFEKNYELGLRLNYCSIANN